MDSQPLTKRSRGIWEEEEDNDELEVIEIQVGTLERSRESCTSAGSGESSPSDTKKTEEVEDGSIRHSVCMVPPKKEGKAKLVSAAPRKRGGKRNYCQAKRRTRSFQAEIVDLVDSDDELEKLVPSCSKPKKSSLLKLEEKTGNGNGGSCLRPGTTNSSDTDDESDIEKPSGSERKKRAKFRISDSEEVSDWVDKIPIKAESSCRSTEESESEDSEDEYYDFDDLDLMEDLLDDSDEYEEDSDVMILESDKEGEGNGEAESDCAEKTFRVDSNDIRYHFSKIPGSSQSNLFDCDLPKGTKQEKKQKDDLGGDLWGTLLEIFAEDFPHVRVRSYP